MKINYLAGDATNPIGEGNKIITHICNDIGGWGKGFVLAISKKWKTPEKKYKEWFAEKTNFELGQVQFIEVESQIIIANIIGQKGIKSIHGIPPIRYEAVAIALKTVAEYAKNKNASVHMPRMGAGLAGGKWEKIEEIIITELIAKDIEVTVYDLEILK